MAIPLQYSIDFTAPIVKVGTLDFGDAFQTSTDTRIPINFSSGHKFSESPVVIASLSSFEISGANKLFVSVEDISTNSFYIHLTKDANATIISTRISWIAIGR